MNEANNKASISHPSGDALSITRKTQCNTATGPDSPGIIGNAGAPQAPPSLVLQQARDKLAVQTGKSFAPGGGSGDSRTMVETARLLKNKEIGEFPRLNVQRVEHPSKKVANIAQFFKSDLQDVKEEVQETITDGEKLSFHNLKDYENWRASKGLKPVPKHTARPRRYVEGDMAKPELPLRALEIKDHSGLKHLALKGARGQHSLSEKAEKIRQYFKRKLSKPEPPSAKGDYHTIIGTGGYSTVTPTQVLEEYADVDLGTRVAYQRAQDALRKLNPNQRTDEAVQSINIETNNRFKVLLDESPDVSSEDFDCAHDADGLMVVRCLQYPAPRTLEKPGVVGGKGVGISANMQNDEGTQVEEKQFDQEIVKIPSRQAVNMVVKNKKAWKVHSQLLNFLRCKYFLRKRDPALINQLVHEARIWLIKNGHSCDNSIDYSILSMSVTAAFLVTEEEMHFRQTIKTRANLDNMKHLNATLDGDLGKVAFWKKFDLDHVTQGPKSYLTDRITMPKTTALV